jgi:phenylpropionate dioxygenase-like ring-hydroxylating dioxygenase large terminal subunit
MTAHVELDMTTTPPNHPLLADAPSWELGFSLPQRYYIDETIFQEDLKLLGQGWILIDHGSRIPNTGDYFTFRFGYESIIIVRGPGGEINAFHNICRHRGSLVCLEAEGSTRAFTCPYHAWTYDLTGALRGAALMQPAFKKEHYGLKRCHVREVDGLIAINLSAEPPDLDSIVAPLQPYLNLHGLKDAKIAARRSYPTGANWKLVIENFAECYHCATAHPTYARVHGRQEMLAIGAGFGSADETITNEYLPEYEKWSAHARTLGYPTGRSRSPIGGGRLTESVDGQPVSTLMGEFKQYDGGQTGLGLGSRTGTVLANNDYAVIFRFIPRSALSTDAEAIWLVNKDAREGIDYSVDTLIQVWDVTLREDKAITENNQLGILSKAYEPGPYSRQEHGLIRFTNWYVSKLAEQLRGQAA